MPNKKLLLHFEFIRDSLSDKPKNVTDLYEEMKTEFDLNYQYVYRDVKDLISMGYIKEVRHDGKTLLLWQNVKTKFEYENSDKVIDIERQYKRFIVIPSVVRQMRLPKYLLKALNDVVSVGEHGFELVLELKAIKYNNFWYRVEDKE